MRKASGLAVYPVSLMIDLIGEHRPEDGVAQVVVALVSGEVGEQVLDGMVNVFLRRDLLVIPVEKRLAILLRTILCNLSGSKQRMRRQEVERIRSGGLSASSLVDFSRHIRLNAQDHAHHSSPSLSSKSSKHIALQDSM